MLSIERITFEQQQDGTTWMVSVIAPSTFPPNGSAFPSERAGKNAAEAAASYMADDDNAGAEIVRLKPEALICVIDQDLAPSQKQWRVHLFCYENGEIVRFLA
jgi:hypothetical protein